MIREHLIELRAVVEGAKDLPEDTKARLLELTAELEEDVAAPVGDDGALVAERGHGDNVPEDSRSGSLVSAIEGFEDSHPELSNAVNNVASMLSKLGF